MRTGSDFAEVKADPKTPTWSMWPTLRPTAHMPTAADLTCFKGQRRRDFTPSGSIPTTPASSCWPATRGGGLGQRRADVGFLVQPADGVLPCGHGRPVPLLGLRRSAGERLGGVCSRGSTGQITFRDWHPSAARNTATSPPIRSIRISSTAARCTSTVTQPGPDVAPEAVRLEQYRFLRHPPAGLRRIDEASLLRRQCPVSDDRRRPQLADDRPDLAAEVPENVGVYRTPELAGMARRGVIYTVAPSYKDRTAVWARHRRRFDPRHPRRRQGDGKTVTPAGLSSTNRCP